MNARQQRALNRMACQMYATAQHSTEGAFAHFEENYVVVPWSLLTDRQRDEWRQRVLRTIRGEFGPQMQYHGPDSPPAEPTPV